MRRTVISMVGIIAVGFTLSHAEMKVGVINSEKIFTEYEGVKTAKEKFDKEVAVWEQQATQKQKDMQSLKDQIDKQSLLLSAERKKALEDSLNQMAVQYQKFLQDKFGQKGEALQKNEELTKPIIEKINKIIDQIAKDENYDLIFDESRGGVVFAKEMYNLNPRVLEALSKEK